MKDFIIPDRDFGTPAAKTKQMVTGSRSYMTSLKNKDSIVRWIWIDKIDQK